MSTSNDPKPLTRKELEAFLPSQRAVRAFEKLFEVVPQDLNVFTDYLEEVKVQPVNVTADYEVGNGNFIILVDATAAPVTITLPDVEFAYSTYNNSYFTIAITKVDTSSNTVTIVPKATQTILNEASQVLLVDGEVINLISEPATTNWELAA